MHSGRFGIKLEIYVFLAFFFAMFGSIITVSLILAAVVFLEKSVWAGKIVIQALCVAIFETILMAVATNLLWFSSIPLIGFIFIGTAALAINIVRLIVFTMSIYAIFKVVKEGDVSLPIFRNFADAIYSKA